MAFNRASKNTNLLLVIIGLLVVIILFLYITSFPFSIQIRNGQDVEGNSRFVFSPEVRQTINFLYGSLNKEYAGCLEGMVQGNVTTIDRFTETDIIYRDEVTLTFRECQRNARYLGTIHSHPVPQSYKNLDFCVPSHQDSFSFGQSEDQITCIQCGMDQLRCFTRDNINQGVVVEYK